MNLHADAVRGKAVVSSVWLWLSGSDPLAQAAEFIRGVASARRPAIPSSP
jgi:hypothetical protein